MNANAPALSAAGSGQDITGSGPLADSALELARAVLIHGPLSRGELSERIGLSNASLTRLSKPLLDAGIVDDGDVVSDGSVGRPLRLLDVRKEAQHFVGIKVTGDSVQGVLTDLRANVLAMAVRPLGGTGIDAVVPALVGVVEELRESAPTALTGVGISVGGHVSADNVVRRAPFLGWRDVPLGGLVEARLGLPVVVDNDVTALVAAEQWFGVGRNVASFAVITVGAGVGYGLAVNDHVIRTPDAGLGLGGHLPLDPAGPLCMDGHRGCSTAMLSIPSICTQISTALARTVGYDEALGLAAEGNPVAVAVMEAAGKALGRMIAVAANLAMVGTVVLGGEGIGVYNSMESTVRAALAADRDPEASAVNLVVMSAEFDQWARGAAAVAIQKLAFVA